MKTIDCFHKKILRGILKFTSVSPVAPLYFLLGELPLEAVFHQDIFSLFWNIWANPHTKVHTIAKYLLMMSDSSSLTWTAHLRILFQTYSLPDPLTLLSGQLMSKQTWKIVTRTAVTTYHEKKWRAKARTNSKLKFLNVEVTGLSCRPHPILSGILTTQDTMRSRVHLKMLAGDYPCYAYIGKDRDQDQGCPLCQRLYPTHPSPLDDLVHLLSRCRATADTRQQYLPVLLNTISMYCPNNPILTQLHHSHVQLTQLILDPTSLNLPLAMRISPDHPALCPVLAVCRTLCHAVHKERTRQLRK